MEKKPVVLLSLFSLLCIGLVFYLFETIKPEPVSNGFTRKFTGSSAQKRRELDLQYNSYYIAGSTKSGIYLGNLEASLRIVKAGADLDTTHFLFALNGADNLTFRSVRIRVDSPLCYFMDGTVPVIFRGDLRERTAKVFLRPADFFTEALPLGSTAFATKVLLRSDNELVLGKLDLQARSTFNLNVLEKQGDGIFSREGIMEFDRERNLLVYTHYYRNEFIVMDSTEKVLLRAHTIDTTAVAKLHVVWNEGRSFYGTASPPQVVNQYTSVSGGRLFIYSVLKADNEPIRTFKVHSVIDVYDLDRGVYQVSFYLPNEGRRLKQFSVTGNTLFALYNTSLIAFRLPRELWDFQ